MSRFFRDLTYHSLLKPGKYRAVLLHPSLRPGKVAAADRLHFLAEAVLQELRQEPLKERNAFFSNIKLTLSGTSGLRQRRQEVQSQTSWSPAKNAPITPSEQGH